MSGGHRVIPVECREGIWYLGPTLDRSYVVIKQNTYPLRTLPAKDKNPADFQTYVDKCSLQAEQPEVYSATSYIRILGFRISCNGKRSELPKMMHFHSCCSFFGELDTNCSHKRQVHLRTSIL